MTCWGRSRSRGDAGASRTAHRGRAGAEVAPPRPPSSTPVPHDHPTVVTKWRIPPRSDHTFGLPRRTPHAPSGTRTAAPPPRPAALGEQSDHAPHRQNSASGAPPRPVRRSCVVDAFRIPILIHHAAVAPVPHRRLQLDPAGAPHSPSETRTAAPPPRPAALGEQSDHAPHRHDSASGAPPRRRHHRPRRNRAELRGVPLALGGDATAARTAHRGRTGAEVAPPRPVSRRRCGGCVSHTDTHPPRRSDACAAPAPSTRPRPSTTRAERDTDAGATPTPVRPR